MDLVSVIAMICAFAFVILGMVMDGGNVLSLLQLPAFIIVIGGTVSAVLLQTPLAIFLRGIKMAGWVFFPPKDEANATLERIMEWVRVSRRESILALDRIAEEQDDEFVRQGLRLVVDGVEASKIRAVLETAIHTHETHDHHSIEIYDAMGGYAPTVGIIGAVLGLITVMSNLSDPSKLGSGIATAFVATVYGVGSANLVFLPIAGKLKLLAKWRVRTMEMVLEGLVGMAVMEKPLHLEMRLRSFVEGGGHSSEEGEEGAGAGAPRAAES